MKNVKKSEFDVNTEEILYKHGYGFWNKGLFIMAVSLFIFFYFTGFGGGSYFYYFGNAKVQSVRDVIEVSQVLTLVIGLPMTWVISSNYRRKKIIITKDYVLFEHGKKKKDVILFDTFDKIKISRSGRGYARLYFMDNKEYCDVCSNLYLSQIDKNRVIKDIKTVLKKTKFKGQIIDDI